MKEGSAWVNNPHDFPCCVPIASQTLHAVGAATAVKIRRENKVVVTSVGDGGTSRGDFYEAINVAGVWNLPVVFIINNNQWAISVPRSKQSKAQTLAQKAIAAGIEGWQIDGNDVIAVKDAVLRAIQKAKEGKGATVIEALSYRMGDHTTADDAKRYRPQHELEENAKYDPVLRLRQYLLTQQWWDEAQEVKLIKEVTEEVAQAAETYLNIADPSPEAMFDWVYETLPEIYGEQRESVKKGHGV
jgi:2-oxoisovalerate dehydrogenase E1 component alpha subunit